MLLGVIFIQRMVLNSQRVKLKIISVLVSRPFLQDHILYHIISSNLLSSSSFLPLLVWLSLFPGGFPYSSSEFATATWPAPSLQRKLLRVSVLNHRS